jgi:phosphatidylserine/phosphatidylglycerophosphate/cardiolipin synthase-like enzyme
VVDPREYLRALQAAERLVYLESQFLWSPEVTRVLAEKLRRPPRDDFRVIVLLPSHPNNGADNSRGQVGLLIDADKKSGDATCRFIACTLYQPGAGGNAVYVHSKAALIDDAWLTVGSANLNEHSLFNDTEANVVVQDPALARCASSSGRSTSSGHGRRSTATRRGCSTSSGRHSPRSGSSGAGAKGGPTGS